MNVKHKKSIAIGTMALCVLLLLLILITSNREQDVLVNGTNDKNLSKDPNKIDEIISNVYGSYESFEKYGVIYLKGKTTIIGIKDLNESLYIKLKVELEEAVSEEIYEVIKVKYSINDLKKMQNELNEMIKENNIYQAVGTGIRIEEQVIILDVTEEIPQVQKEILQEKFGDLLIITIVEDTPEST
ncbi:hypothetical protein ACFSCX_17605 [Bacillus salitolerans]|uniref:Uncharacterized protein n=1 Tax=Bacillus salitolerans TaxID=1437434 RepID=A0ABW4LV62_9BACI